MDTIEHLLQRGQQAQGGGVSQSLLSAPEAERIISQLAPLDIEEVGSAKWHTQHEWIERLNLQAHYNAQTHSDEFVVELLVSLDKLHVLVHELLVIEAWKEHVYPHLAAHLAERVDSVTAYLLLYHEVTVANLLQVALYHSHAAESLSEDYALEVADWCSRKLTRLNAEGQRMAEHRERSAEELLSQGRLEEQEEKRREVEFSVLMCSLNILRYVTDALPRLPMGALSRVVSTNDTLMGLLPLLERPPWVRTRSPGGGGGGGRPVLEKWAGNRWAAVAPADRFKITQTDGQVWLAVTNLLVEPRCRAKYVLDEFRRERILGLRRHLNELLFDQLPVLRDLQRVLDELALGVLPDAGGAGKAGGLILEAVPVVRDALLRGRNWAQLAERARAAHFGRDAERMARERIEAMVKHLDFLCELEPEPEAAGKPGAAGGKDGAAAAPEPHPPVKVTTWRKVHDSGVFESWCDFAMEVDDARPPEPVEVAAPAGAASSSSAGGGGGGGKANGGAPLAAVQGLRYRLRPLDPDATRPLPANGKAVVRWGGLAAEALLQLPELPTRASEEGAAVLWVTVGLLAVDGLALQVKLKKAAKPKERDRVAGVWYAYHPVAGALTVLRGAEGAAAAGGGAQQQQQQAGAAAKAQKKVEPLAAAGKAAGAAPPARPLVHVMPAPAPAAAPAAAPAGAKPSAAAAAAPAPEPAGSSAAREDAQEGAAARQGAVPPPSAQQERRGGAAEVASISGTSGPKAAAAEPAAAAGAEHPVKAESSAAGGVAAPVAAAALPESAPSEHARRPLTAAAAVAAAPASPCVGSSGGNAAGTGPHCVPPSASGAAAPPPAAAAPVTEAVQADDDAPGLDDPE